MFRAIEGVYKISKAFVQVSFEACFYPLFYPEFLLATETRKLGQQSVPSQSSGGSAYTMGKFRAACGIHVKLNSSYLHQQVEDLAAPYERYASIYLTNFNTYTAIVNNEKLSDILAKMSTISRPIPPLDRWTIDTFFLLPYARLRYYRRMYEKLLKSATEGKSDHRMLQDALDSLDRIVMSVKKRLDMDVNQVEKDGEEEVFRRMKRNGADAEQRPEQSLSARTDGSTPSAVPLTANNGSATSTDKGLTKLEEERRSVAKWEEQKRNTGSDERQQGSTASSGGKRTEDTHQT